MSAVRQEAPDPIALRDLVARVRYRENYSFRLVDEHNRGQGSVGLTLIITVCAQNSRIPERTIYVDHYMIVPAAAYDARSWRRWLFEQILLVETHEAAEFFCIGDDRPYAPSHGPGNDPYMIREVGTLADHETDQRGARKPS
jgi:hypothetical protein